MRKHPDVKEKGAQLDMSDLKSDPVLIMQRKLVPVHLSLGSITISLPDMLN